MNVKNNNFLIDRLKSIPYALRGAWLLIRSENSIIAQAVIALVMTIVGFIVRLSALEWMMQMLAIGLVLVAEALNTAIEKLCDFVHPKFHPKIGDIKDISAGASVFAAITAVIIGILIYGSKLKWIW